MNAINEFEIVEFAIAPGNLEVTGTGDLKITNTGGTSSSEGGMGAGKDADDKGGILDPIKSSSPNTEDNDKATPKTTDESGKGSKEEAEQS